MAPTIVEALAAQTPLWEPGTQHGYHAITYGWLVGEVIRRVTGLTVDEAVQREIAEPLGLDGLRVGEARVGQHSGRHSRGPVWVSGAGEVKHETRFQVTRSGPSRLNLEFSLIEPVGLFSSMSLKAK